MLLSFNIVDMAKYAIRKQARLIKNDMKFFDMISTITDMTRNENIIIILTKWSFFLLYINIAHKQTREKNSIIEISKISIAPEVNRLFEKSPPIL